MYVSFLPEEGGGGGKSKSGGGESKLRGGKCPPVPPERNPGLYKCIIFIFPFFSSLAMHVTQRFLES